MKSAKTLVISVLALTTIGGAALAWQQYNELIELRAAAMNKDERADLQKKIWDLEKANKELEDKVASRRGSDSDDIDAMLAEATGIDPRQREGRGGDRSSRGAERAAQQAAAQQTANALRELMNKPEVQALLNQQRTAAIENRYGALFKSMNLTPDQTAKLTALLAERGNVRQDVMEAARAQGIDPRQNPEAFQKLMADSRAQVDASIKATLGDAGYAQLQNYEQTMPQRNLVEDLQRRLNNSNNPLTAQQADQLVQILANNAPQRQTTQNGTNSATNGQQQNNNNFGGRGGPGGGGFGGGPGGMGAIGAALGGMGGFDGGRGGFGGGGATITSQAVAQSQTVLAPQQVAALQQMQQQQQSRQQVQQLVQDTIAANQPTKSGTTTTNNGTTGNNTQKRRTKDGGK